MNKTAIVIGATGLVGSEVLDLLLEDERYQTVKVFHRRSTGISHPKLEEHVIDFEKIEEWRDLITGDELYSALGTTAKRLEVRKPNTPSTSPINTKPPKPRLKTE